MTLPVLSMPPDQSNYQLTDGHTTVSTQLDGGAGRYRADVLGASYRLVCQWTCDKRNFNYIKAFYRTSTVFGSLPFQIALMIDGGDLDTYTAYFLPDTFNLISQSGNTWIVGATLEVLFDPTFSSGDAAIIAAGPD